MQFISLQLSLNQFEVTTFSFDQLIMRTFLGDITILDNMNYVGFPDRRQPMRNGDGRPPNRGVGQSLVDLQFGRGIQG